MQNDNSIIVVKSCPPGALCPPIPAPRTRTQERCVLGTPSLALAYFFAFGSRVTSRGSPAQMESFFEKIHLSMPKEKAGK